MHRHSCVIAIICERFTVKQHRLEMQRTHRYSCVIAILCERIYSETAQIENAENVQTLGCVIAIL